MTSKYRMKFVPCVVSEVRRTRLFLEVKYAFIKNSYVPGFMIWWVLLIRFSMVFMFLCFIFRLDM